MKKSRTYSTKSSCEVLDGFEADFEVPTEDNIKINMAEGGASKDAQTGQKIARGFSGIGSR